MDNLHRDPAKYDDVDSFRPERFLGDDLDALTSARQKDYRKRDHFNYGFGRRMCPGMSLSSILFRMTRLIFFKKAYESQKTRSSCKFRAIYGLLTLHPSRESLRWTWPIGQVSGVSIGYMQSITHFADGFRLNVETITRKPKPFQVDFTPRSEAIRQVIQQTAKEARTDIPDVDTLEMGS